MYGTEEMGVMGVVKAAIALRVIEHIDLYYFGSYLISAISLF
jgi:hypothetical protein